MEILFDLILDDLAGPIFELLLELVVRLAEALFHLIGWLLERFRRWLDLQPNIDPAQLSLLHRFGRLSVGVGLSLCILAPLLWLIWR
ncbi:hypothetical protein [Bradyrhizobium iriomotense]|uniref:Mechanosensitive ion channel protein MscS n=1 Tax=Bradyrhizobium iriomotense TaxID=441950 RepID=A0ABQ6B109_9BRAD|nr:hypothetical protein [Bradyrhizobium iriomotense]GLR87853.1 hypothetical protein GCM10007857_45650 [Bradyrhizobium iriomotense]